jgi:hypothetical protein
METNKGDTDLSRLVLFDPETGKEEVVESDPLGKVDFGNPVFSEATDELVGTSYEDERPRLYFRDKAYEADYKLLQQKLPGREIAVGGTTATTSSGSSPRAATSIREAAILFDRKTKALTPAVHDPRAHPARPDGEREGDPLSLVRRTVDPGLPHPAQGRAREEPAPHRPAPTAGPGRATTGASTTWRSSWPTAATRCCSRTSAARPATARSSSTRATNSGATGCRTTSRGA